MQRIRVSFFVLMFTTFFYFSSCRKSVDACVNFDQAAYAINDTIYADASCSENVDEYLWEPQGGLQMLGNGTSSTERFIVLSLPGNLNRSVKLEVKNKKSSKSTTKSTLIL